MGRGWQIIAAFTIRQRIPILIIMVGLTIVLYFVRSTEISYDFAKIVPKNHPELVEYLNFKEEFGEDGNVMIVGMEGDVFSLKYFQGLAELHEQLKKVEGITNVLSLAGAANIVLDTSSQKFQAEKVMRRVPTTQAEMDSLRTAILNMPFYKGLLYDDSITTSVLAVTFSQKKLDSKDKIKTSDDVIALAEAAGTKMGAKAHFSGLPYIRSYTIKFLPGEMSLFFSLSILISAIALFFFFRSLVGVVIPLIVIAIVVVWTMGFMGILGYKVTHLIAVLPALIVVIGVPNVVLINTKYHIEYKRTQNKMKSLILVIQRIGLVTVMTNATTAVGFFTLVFTRIKILVEFGIVGAAAVVITFVVSLLLIPIIFSFLPPPNPKQTKHTDGKLLNKLLEAIDRLVHKRRWLVYGGATLILAGFAVGLTRLESVAHMVDDLPRNSRVHTDLAFLENRFGGVMPFEVLINTHDSAGVFQPKVLKKLDRFQRAMDSIPGMSRSISLLDLIKFSRQAWLKGDPAMYLLPDGGELAEIAKRRPDSLGGNALATSAKISDKAFSKIRVKANVADMGSVKMQELVDTVQTLLDSFFVSNRDSGKLKAGMEYKLYGTDSFAIRYAGKEILNGEKFTAGKDNGYAVVRGAGKVDYADRYMVTGTTKIFLKSNEYLVSNLVQSLILGILINAFLIGLTFRKAKMLIVSLIPNFIPMLVTAGVMGFIGMPLKPSTAIIFSIAFGISVDTTIHYLARFRLARKFGDNVSEAVSNSFKDTGLSMIYTSIILFFGFGILSFSGFGSITALGQLTSLTLLVALIANLIILPSLIISMFRDTEKVDDGIMEYDEMEENGTAESAT